MVDIFGPGKAYAAYTTGWAGKLYFEFIINVKGLTLLFFFFYIYIWVCLAADDHMVYI